MEAYAYGTSKDVIFKKKIKQLSVIKTIPECLTLVLAQMNT